MVCLRMCGPCSKGEHEKCERGKSAGPGVYGGWMCTCPCMGRSEAQIEADRKAEFKQTMRDIDALHGKARK